MPTKQCICISRATSRENDANLEKHFVFLKNALTERKKCAKLYLNKKIKYLANLSKGRDAKLGG